MDGDLWISPTNPQRMIEGNDGGGNVTLNGGKTWTDQDYPTGQFYNVFLTKHVPYHVCGAQQDNTTACVSSSPATGFFASMVPPLFYEAGGGESGYIAPDPNDPEVFYAGSFGGYISRFDRRTNQRRQIDVWPDNPMGYGSESITERFQWTFPIVFSPVDKKTIFVSSQHLWRTTTEGQRWERISPDLTRHDPKTMIASGAAAPVDTRRTAHGDVHGADTERELQEGRQPPGVGPPLRGLSGLSRHDHVGRGAPARSRGATGVVHGAGVRQRADTDEGIHDRHRPEARRNHRGPPAQEQFTLATQIRDKVTEANAAVIQVRSIRQQVKERLDKVPPRRRPEVQKLFDGMMKPLTAVEEEVYQVKLHAFEDPLNYPIKLNNKIASLAGVVQSADARPTDQSYEVFKQLSRQLDGQIQKLTSALATDLPRVNAALRREKIAPVDPKGKLEQPRGDSQK